MSIDKSVFEGTRVITGNGLNMYTRTSSLLVAAPVTDIVLVHGLSVSSGYMLPTATRLAPSYRVWLPDLPGFGRSAKPPHILNVAELADALVAWMDAVKLPSASFMGNSLGCQIIVSLAVRYPERIKCAILVSPTMDPDARTIHQVFGRLLQDAGCEPLYFLPVLLREYVIAGVPRTIRTLQYAFEDRVEEHLPEVRVPTLVVHGSRDPIVPQPWAERVHRLIPYSRFVSIQGAGHAVNFNSPDRLVSLIKAFLAGTPYPDEGERIENYADSGTPENG